MINISGITLEIIKNLALLNVNKIGLLDQNKVKTDDLVYTHVY